MRMLFPWCLSDSDDVPANHLCQLNGRVVPIIVSLRSVSIVLGKSRYGRWRRRWLIGSTDMQRRAHRLVNRTTWRLTASSHPFRR